MGPCPLAPDKLSSVKKKIPPEEKCQYCAFHSKSQYHRDKHFERWHRADVEREEKRKRLTAKKKPNDKPAKVPCKFCFTLYARSYVRQHERLFHEKGFPSKPLLQGGLVNPR